MSLAKTSDELSGQVALVTGAAKGIGRAIAAKLVSQGARVVVADVDLDEATVSASDIGGVAAPLDVTASSSVSELAEWLIGQYGRLDILVNNAGIHIQKLAVDLTDDEWDRIQHVNARGCFYTCRAFAPHMIRREHGRVINIITRLVGNPFSSAYMASKGAIWSFTQCLALELAPYNITVNAVAPGHVGVGTGMERWFRAKADLLGVPWEEFERRVMQTIPLGRWCRPEDVASTVAFLASAEAVYITAEQINVTGGWTGYGVTPPKGAGRPDL